MLKVRDGMRPLGGGAIMLALFGAASCAQQSGPDEPTETRVGAVTATTGAGGSGSGGTGGDGLAPLLPATQIPRFQNQLPRFFTYAPTLTRNAAGQVTRKEFTVHIAKFNEQQLPSGFPSTPLFGYGGDVFVRYDANGQPVPAIEQTGPSAFMRTSPGPEVRADRAWSRT